MEKKKFPDKPRKYVANPVFEKWLLEWYIAARNIGSPAQYNIARALKSMTKCPLRFETGKECFLLEHFTEKLCDLIDKKIQDESGEDDFQQDLRDFMSNSTNPEEEKDVIHGVDEFDNGKEKTAAVDIPSSKEKVPTIPGNKSQSIIVMRALYEAKQSSLSDFITIRQLQTLISDICKDTLDADETLQWFGSILSDLITHKLVSKMNCPVKYGLTDLGVSLVKAQEKEKRKAKEVLAEREEEEKFKKRKEEENSKKKKNEEETLKKGKKEEEKPKRRNEEEKLTKWKEDEKDKGGKSNRTDSTGEVENSDRFVLDPYSFDVILIVDVHETNAKSKDGNETSARFKQLNTRFSVQHLTVGDFAWIARCRKTLTELTLPYVVERKRVDDLSSSIKDGRFHEQKFRLKRSGIKNIIYLVEGLNPNVQTGIPITSLQQAAINSLVQDGFTLKYTGRHKDTILYLSNMTTVLYNQYKDKRLISCKKSDLDSMVDTEKTKYLMVFDEFNKTSSKNKVLRVQEMFVRQLAQLKGLSIDKALAITSLYPTPSLLQQALLESGENSLVNIKVNNRKIGDNIGQAIYQLYTRETLN